MPKKKRKGGFADVVRVVGLALVAAAVVKELRTPADEREWHGKLGFVPYELRPPTLARFKERVWAPDSDTLVGPRVFGVGWTVNLGRVWTLARHTVAHD